MPELIPAEPGSPEWLAARRAGVTATDIVTILGLSSYDSAYSLYWRKLGQVPEVEDNDRIRLGRELEPYIRERWSQERTEAWHFEGGALWRHQDRDWQMATPDYRVGSGLDSRQPLTGVLEVKTWADADRHSWQDGPPARVRAQVLWQMDVMDVATGHVGVLFLPSGEFRSYVIEHDGTTFNAELYTHGDFDELQACAACRDIDLMRAAGLEFYDRLMYKLPPPDLDASAATLAAVKARFAKAPDKEAEIDPLLWQDWTNAKDDAAHYAAKVREFESKMREQAGSASVLTVDGEPVARRVVSEQQVKAHTRHMDYLRKLNNSEASHE